MVRISKERDKRNNSKELELYKKLKEIDQSKLKELFFEYLKKDFEKISSDFLDYLKKDKIAVPDTIFNKKLTVLESIVKYLIENRDLSYKEASLLINRDQRNLWHAYNSAIKKLPQKFVIEKYEFLIPVSIFSNRKLSIQENLVFYLKTKFDLSYHKIATLIHRDDRTVWTVYQKATRKNEKK